MPKRDGNIPVIAAARLGARVAFVGAVGDDDFGAAARAALAAEGIFAFFLESGFLAVLLYGWDRVGPKMHFFSAVMVAIGGITIANSPSTTRTMPSIRNKTQCSRTDCASARCS